MKKYIIIIVLLVAVGTIKATFFSENNNPSTYSIKTFEIEKGWGYSIFKHDKLIIRQDLIPAIGTMKHFENEKDAETCAKIMLNKLQQHQIPSITLKELQQNNIHL